LVNKRFNIDEGGFELLEEGLSCSNGLLERGLSCSKGV